MPFASLIGNEAAKHYIQNIMATQALGAPLLFSGPSGVGKCQFAHVLAQQLVGSNTLIHPDIRVVRPEGKIAFHSIEVLRSVRDEAQQSPYQGPCRVIILDDAERVRPEAANALLKTFEEPLVTTQLILISSRPDALLPTILSRCRHIRFCPVEETQIASWLTQQHGVAEDHAIHCARLAQGVPARALDLAQGEVWNGRSALLQCLACGGFSSYLQLRQLVEELTPPVSQESSTPEVEGIEFNAIQKAAVAKEQIGQQALAQQRYVEELFEALILWYRDLELLNVGADPTHLTHSDFALSAEQAFQRGLRKPLDQVIEAVNDTRTSLERSSPLAATLEALFVRLELL